MKLLRRHWLPIAAVALGLVALLASVAEARPGGGQSYSGGGGHGGGGGGGGGDGLVNLLIYLIIYHPQIGIPVTFVIIIGYVVVRRGKKDLTDWDTGPPVYRGPPPDLEKIRRFDPDFSIVLFDDFVYRLYATAHKARGQVAEIDKLAPYLSPGVRGELLSREPAGVPVSNVIVGAMRVTGLQLPPAPQSEEGDPLYIGVGLEFEANMTAGAAGAEQTYFVVEHWQLTRAATAHSKPPESAERFPCPNCGAPFESSDSQKCDFCGEVVDNGRFDWLVTHSSVSHVSHRKSLLTTTVQERGTDLPTVVHPNVDQAWAALLQSDPAITQEAIGRRLQMIYGELNQAWSNLDLATARPFVSDGLFDYLQYWIGAYKQQGLRNVLEEMRLYHWTYARIIRDKYFDSLTVRIWGTGRDYTVESASGKKVSGSSRRERNYTEYWTLIRSASRKGEVMAEKNCPSCGADMKISMAGDCEYCGTHITSGEFDWVLSKIEQDDSYRG